MRSSRAAAAWKNSSTEPRCTLQNTIAVVVPLRSSSSRKKLRDAARVRGARERHLGRIGVVPQPVEQRTAAGGDDVGLRIVDVRVDKARDEDVRRRGR